MIFDKTALNEAQRAAMEDTEGAVLVLAGAGSGKTRVLTYRVCHLVADLKVEPYNILAITFTNKATNEMRERLNTLLGDNRVWVSTFHSLCCSILRDYAEKLGYTKSFSIYDEDDAQRAMKKVLKEMDTTDGFDIRDKIFFHISSAKNAGLTPLEYYKEIKGVVKNSDEIYKAFAGYEEHLRKSNAMDFDDLLHKTYQLFTDFPETLEKYAKRFRYIHVDEFQDTNAVQFKIVQKLSAIHGNIFVVGDDDQSIYGWRGADIKNILSFEKVYPNAKIHKLLRNYRSTPKILGVANNIIRNNKSRYDKQLYTEQNQGVNVEFFDAVNDYQEADFVLDNIIALKRFNGYSNKDFAILVRANSLTRLFENRLSTAGLPYKVYGGFRFFERKEVLDVLAYLRIAANPKDGEAIGRVINFPRRGIGDAAVEKLYAYARKNGVDIVDAILNLEEIADLKAAKKGLESFRLIVADLWVNKNLPLYKFTDYLVKRVGFETYYQSCEKEDERDRWENIEEFLNYVAEFAQKYPDATLYDFIQSFALMPDAKNDDKNDDAVVLATMHSVKGLEFKAVFVTCCEEEIFPSSQALRNGEIDEERRLMYVAVTRARERLFITSAATRFRFNQKIPCIRSRFIAEARGGSIEDSYNEYANKRPYAGKEFYNKFRDMNADTNEDAYVPPRAANAPKKVSETAVPLKTPENKVYNRDLNGFKAGASVVHSVYGEGKIVIIIGEGSEATATVLFPKLGVKKFRLALTPLKLL